MRKTVLMGACLAFGALTGALALSAQAQSASVQLLGEFKVWKAYKGVQGGETVCYIATEPKKSQGQYSRRGAAAAVVAHWPEKDPVNGESNINDVSMIMGYPIGSNEPVKVSIGKKRFDLVGKGSEGWAYDEDKPALTTAMRQGATMVVESKSKRGTYTKDTYSLSGFSAAYNAIGKACGVR